MQYNYTYIAIIVWFVKAEAATLLDGPLFKHMYICRTHTSLYWYDT